MAMTIVAKGYGSCPHCLARIAVRPASIMSIWHLTGACLVVLRKIHGAAWSPA